MAAKFVFSPHITVRGVEVPVVQEDGNTEMLRLDAKYKRATYTECAALKRREDIEVVRDRLVSIAATDDETGEVVTLPPEVTAQLLEVSSAPYALALAFFRASQGTPAKNS